MGDSVFLPKAVHVDAFGLVGWAIRKSGTGNRHGQELACDEVPEG